MGPTATTAIMTVLSALSLSFLVTTVLPTALLAQEPRQSQLNPVDGLGELLKVNAPVVLCIDDKPATGGQPSERAYANAAANGFRSVLTLRSKNDGVNPLRERFLVESSKMRYFNLPATGGLPPPERVDEFLRLVRDHSNHPMLINCAFAARVAPYMLIFRIVVQRWKEEKALDETAGVGIRRDDLQKFARNYIAARKIR